MGFAVFVGNGVRDSEDGDVGAGRDLPWPTATPDQDPVLPGVGDA